MSSKPKGSGATPPSIEENTTADEPVSPAARRGSPKNEVLFATVGQKIVEARKALDMSQSQLARAAETPVSTVFSAENGQHNTSLGTLQKIADALRLELRDLMPGKDAPSSPNESLAMLKLVEGALQTSLTEMGRTTLMLQQVRKLVTELQKPSSLKSETEH